MHKARLVTDLTIVTIYLSLVGLLFHFDFSLVLSLLAVPWSIPLMMFSGLIVHITVDGAKLITVGYVAGSILNSLLLILLRNR
jgi:hypothetical protein